MDQGIESRLLSHPVLLIAPKTFFGGMFDDKAIQYAVKLYQGRINYFRELGVELRVLGADKFGSISKNHFQFTQELERQVPESTLLIPCSVERRNFYLWPRDYFQVFGGIVFASPGYKKATANILRRLGAAVKSRDIITSQFGQGGYVIRAGNQLIVSDRVREPENEALLREMGYKVHYFPTLKSNKDLGRADPLSPMIATDGHIDPFVNIALTKSGELAMAVYECYHKRFSKELKPFISEHVSQLHVFSPSDSEYRRKAVNWLDLLDGRIVLPNLCESVELFLRGAIGTERVSILPMDSGYDLRHENGGLRCMTNLIQ